MNPSRNCIRLLVGLVCLCSFVYASPVPVQPVTVQEAEGILLQLENNQQPFVRDAKNPLATGLQTQIETQMSSPWWDQSQLDVRPRDRRLIAEPLPHYTRHELHLTYGTRNSLDMPACSLVTSPSLSVSYYSGIVPGDAFKIWMDPDLCSECAPAIPFRLDSATILLVQNSWTVADTVYLGIDVECARFDPLDPCRGPGQERCFQVYRVILPADEEPSGLNLWTVSLALGDCWMDGAGFIGLWHLGHTLPDNISFHPSIAFDAESDPPVADCEVWANLSGLWAEWTDVWDPPTPGYPILTLHGECDAPSPPYMDPCPVACTQQRIGTTQTAFYDPSTTAVWEWFGVPPPDLIFPYKPLTIDFSLYYPAAGAASDCVQVMVMYGCRRFDDLCCVPMEVLCAGQIWLTRENPIANYVMPVSLDLSGMSCCLQEDFWVGAAIVGIGAGDPIPSFLWSSTAADPNPVPDCHQWVFRNSIYQHWPSETMGWADFVLSGSCEDCLDDMPLICPPPSTEVLDCSDALPVACGSVTLTGQTNSGGNQNVSSYCCSPWDESGPEKVYRIEVPADHYLTASLSSLGGPGDVDVFLLDACAPTACIAFGDNVASAGNLAAGTYYIVVDGWDGGVSTYTLSIDCYLPCNATICVNSLGGPTTNSRYLDGEWDAILGIVYYSYGVTGSAASNRILRWDPETCALLSPITWTPAEAAECRLMAADNRGYIWAGVIYSGYPLGGKLYLLNLSTGAVVTSWTNIAGLASMLWSGAAYDPDHHHLWIFLLGQGESGTENHAYELDVSNPLSPVVIQGPHQIPFDSPYSILSSG
ncbi:MAG: PPC domain-containing protein, partial [bacterium]|nr:PPC domain-containing protein [bacterium]